MEANIEFSEKEVETQTVTEQNNEEIIEVKLVDVPVTDMNVALNIIFSFMQVAQKRGTFSIDESAKIWECMKFFLQPGQLQEVSQQTSQSIV